MQRAGGKPTFLTLETFELEMPHASRNVSRKTQTNSLRYIKAQS